MYIRVAVEHVSDFETGCQAIWKGVGTTLTCLTKR